MRLHQVCRFSNEQNEANAFKHCVCIFYDENYILNLIDYAIKGCVVFAPLSNYKPLFDEGHFTIPAPSHRVTAPLLP